MTEPITCPQCGKEMDRDYIEWFDDCWVDAYTCTDPECDYYEDA